MSLNSRPSLRLLLPLILLVTGGILLVHARTQQPRQPSAAYTRAGLSVSIPYHSTHSGSGRLLLEVLNPDDQVLGHINLLVEASSGNSTWQQNIPLSTPISNDDIVWDRVRFRFQYNDTNLSPIAGIASISDIIRRPVVHILGQSQYLAGSEAAIRVIVSDAANNDIPATGTVRVELNQPNHAPQSLFSGTLNRRGTIEAQFRFPASLTGSVDLHYIAETPIGTAEFTQPIQLNDKASILLTTEKPIYQPGQTIHIRALALDRAADKADSSRKLTFELEDSRGNKVFKKITATDNFGIASAEFSLADEVNLGAYHLRAILGESNTAEITLNVERYVLPKFKVDVEFTQKNNKPRRDYRPGDHVTGTVRSNYFFGKPVDHADITIKASSADVAVLDVASATGKTDADGVYHFDLKLPSYFAGRPLSQGAARALIEATVTDSATHAETRGEPITISQSALLLTAVPEGGTLIPHIENQIFLLASYPDGTPAAAALTIHTPFNDEAVSTDAGGVALIHLTPGTGAQTLHIEADDHRGNTASSDVPLEARTGTDHILLRTTRAVVKAGERIQLKVLSTRRSGTAYVDVVRNGQTILTRDLDLQNGQADLTLTATPDMAGTLDVDAYLFSSSAQPIADHRLLFVQPADELTIATSADAASYKPGAEARVHFHVTNSHGQGVSAALGLQVVDEAVFALAEKQPGFAKVFFYLEQEVMKPRFEIHSISMPSVISPIESRGGASSGADPDLAARALFSATELAAPAQLNIEFGRTIPQLKRAEYIQRYQAAFTEQVRTIAARLSQQVDTPRSTDNFIQLFNDTTAHDPDAWATPLRLEAAGWWGGQDRLYRVRSAGPDHRFNTGDDLVTTIADHSGSIITQPGQRGSIHLNIEHNRGPVNGLAEITGTLTDASGAVIPNATIILHQLIGANTRTTRTNNEGQFTLAALPAGRYQVDFEALGFEHLSGSITLEPRDRAILIPTLTVGSAMQSVTVAAQPLPKLAPAPIVHAGIGAGIGGAARGQAFAVAAAAAPLLHTEDALAGTILDASAIENIPLYGRNLTDLRVERKSAASAPEPHIRSWFPEALYINPEILTDSHGDATISIPIADSITTWRMAMLASTTSGALGTSASSLKVFQDFFVDLDLPVTLTQGDRVSLPVAIYNYSGKQGSVSLNLKPEDWFSLDNDSPQKSLNVESGRVGSSQFTVNANRIGKFKLTLTAHMEGHDDIVVRDIEVIPNGREQSLVFNGRLTDSITQTLNFPAASIPDASTLFVRLYPGPLSQVIEGMDGILRMPGGCFEQTSSSTYPNVLALDYMKRTNKLTPEVHARAEGYIANGYQRLLTFEVPGGGFSWFGQAPANKILTAYGLMEFSDMSKVSDVDPALIARTRDWLARQQQPDGSWRPDTNFINEGATNRYNNDVLRITAYIAWSLANTGYQGPAIERAKRFIEANTRMNPDAYTLAIIANFAADYEKAYGAHDQDARDFTRQSMQNLLDARTEKDDTVSWTTEETNVYSTGPSAAIETTGLATQALLKWGQSSETVRKALNFITSKKQAAGNWGTTQATIMALRALLLASQTNGADVRGTVQVVLNGNTVQTLTLDAENNDLLHQFAFKDIDPTQPNNVQLKFSGTGGLAYQIAGRYFTPWNEKPAATDALSINVAYDRTSLAQNDIATATATIHNNLTKTANMVMVDLGIPPGFDLLSEDLQSLQEKSTGNNAPRIATGQPQARRPGTVRPQPNQPQPAPITTGNLQKFSLTATQAILYFDALGPQQTITIKFRLRAKYPIRAKTFPSRAYEYYAPEITATAQPTQLQITPN